MAGLRAPWLYRHRVRDAGHTIGWVTLATNVRRTRDGFYFDVIPVSCSYWAFHRRKSTSVVTFRITFLSPMQTIFVTICVTKSW